MKEMDRFSGVVCSRRPPAVSPLSTLYHFLPAASHLSTELKTVKQKEGVRNVSILVKIIIIPTKNTPIKFIIN